jgi:hypothetical protein
MKKILILFSFFLLANVGCTVSDPEMMELLQEIKAQNDKLLQEVETMKGQLSLLDGKYQVILASLADNKKELEALKSQIDSLKGQISQQLIKIEQLSSQLTQQGADIIKLSQEIKELKASCQELKDKIDELLNGRSPVPTNGLVAWYPFNGNSNDESGFGNNGQITKAILVSDRNGVTNNAFKFDHAGKVFGQLNNEIFLPYKPIFNQERISVSVWVNPKSFFWIGDSANPNSAIIRRFEQGYSNPNGQAWGIGYSKNDFYAFILESSSQNNQKSSVLRSSNPLELGKWAHLVFTFDGTNFKLYYNGILLKQTTTDLILNKIGSSGISIGVSRQANGFWEDANAEIDDVAIWNRALSESEISKIYKGEKF